MGRDPGAFGPERLLYDLDDDLLALFEQVFNLRGGQQPIPIPRAAIGAGGAGRFDAIGRDGLRDFDRLFYGRHHRVLAFGGLRRDRRCEGLVLVVLEGFFGGADDVGNVEKGVAFETQINERRLHAGKHLGHAAFVDIADDAP